MWPTCFAISKHIGGEIMLKVKIEDEKCNLFKGKKNAKRQNPKSWW